MSVGTLMCENKNGGIIAMQKVKISTDSTADIPAKKKKKFHKRSFPKVQCETIHVKQKHIYEKDDSYHRWNR